MLFLFFVLMGTAAGFSQVGVLSRRRGVSLLATTTQQEAVSAEDLYKKWGVCIEERSSWQEGGPRFNSLDQDYVVETYSCELEKKATGLGLELEEIAAMADGVGVVVVSGLKPGSPADQSDIQAGDVIAAVGDTSVEAFSYDKLVAVVGSDESDSVLSLKMKRLVARPKIRLSLTYANDEYPQEEHLLYAGENLRRAMLARGVKLNDALARRFDNQMQGAGDCGGEGTCCTCAVAVLRGREVISEQKTQERQMLKPTPSWRLACKARVGTDMAYGEVADLAVRVNPNQRG